MLELESVSGWTDGLGGVPAGVVRLVFLSSMVVLIVLSVILPLLTRLTPLEEVVRGVFRSDGLRLREVTLAGGLLSSESRFSFPRRPSLFSF